MDAVVTSVPPVVLWPTALLPLQGVVEEFLAAFSLQYLLSVVLVTLEVSLTAVGIATVFGLLTALALAFTEFPGKTLVETAVNTGMGFPSVVVGLAVLLVLSNSGPLGELQLLFTRRAMVISQVILAFPVITSVSLSAIEGVDQSLRDAALAAGGTRRDVQLTVVREARYGVVTAVLAGFGRAVSEVGSVLIVGGNLAVLNATGEKVSLTRTLTTAITIEARKGQYEVGIVLGVVLFVLALAVNALGSYVRDRGGT
jgi:tungstate transport system permease protein